MSTLKVLKEYLVGNNGYLLNEGNNGKIAMLSGAWGSGKTHFWQNEITPKLIDALKSDNRASVYVSLYGKESLKEIKEEVFFKASKEKDYLSKEIEVFGFDALSTISDSGGDISKGIKTLFDLNKYRRNSKGKNRLTNGGLICFDDFERKSKNVDLNDLFGFISQLAITLNCKVVIILNSDVFEGEEANVFKTVKEKTVNKFFYFNPEKEELFDSIYKSNEQYEEKLSGYKSEILKAIKDTEELNARIYIQVLDNCLEWIEKGYNDKALRVLVLTTVNFILNHVILDYGIISIELIEHKPEFDGDIELNQQYKIIYNKLGSLNKEIINILNNISAMEDTIINSNTMSEENIFTDKTSYLDLLKEIDKIDFFNKFNSNIKNISRELQFTYNDSTVTKNDIFQLWKYGYQLFIFQYIDKITYTEIKNFIKTGILLKKEV